MLKTQSCPSTGSGRAGTNLSVHAEPVEAFRVPFGILLLVDHRREGATHKHADEVPLITGGTAQGVYGVNSAARFGADRLQNGFSDFFAARKFLGVVNAHWPGRNRAHHQPKIATYGLFHAYQCRDP